MPSNNIALIEKYSPEKWDTVYKQESVVSLLDASNSALVRFEGTKTVKIGKFQNGGLHDYYRNNASDDRFQAPATGTNFVGNLGFGYQRSNMALTWEEFTLEQDRAAMFPVEYFDNEESGAQLVGLGVTEISRTTLIPEVDAYCLSKIASYCTTALGNYIEEDITDKPLASLNNAFVYFDEHEVPVDDQLTFVSPKFMNSLRTTSEVTKFLGQTDFGGKDVKFTITTYEGRKLISVSPERLRTNILIKGQEGYRWAANSKAINFLMVAKSAVTHVVKYEKVKVLEGDVVKAMGYDGYAVFVRIYHDVFVPDNKRIALYCSVAKTGAAAPAMKLDVLVGNGKIKSITTVPGNKLAFTATSSTTAEVGSKLTGYTLVNVGDKVTADTTFYAIDSNEIVLAKQSYTAPEEE